MCGFHQLVLRVDLLLWKMVLAHLNVEMCHFSQERSFSPLSFGAACPSESQCQPEEGRMPKDQGGNSCTYLHGCRGGANNGETCEYDYFLMLFLADFFSCSRSSLTRWWIQFQVFGDSIFFYLMHNKTFTICKGLLSPFLILIQTRSGLGRI